MTKQNRTILILLVIFNLIVLLGQAWPEGAPPFARVVNIITLAANILFLFSLLRK